MKDNPYFIALCEGLLLIDRKARAKGITNEKEIDNLVEPHALEKFVAVRGDQLAAGGIS